MKNNNSLVILLLCSAVHLVAFSAEPPAEFGERILRVEQGLLLPIAIEGRIPPMMTITERMQYYKVPGVSIAVINKGVIEWARGYGVLDVEGQVPVNENTLFQAASISKPVFAMATLSLVEKGELELDEDVNLKLQSWKIPENEFTKKSKVTLRYLLTHTAGTSPGGFGGYPVGMTVPTVLQLLDGIPPSNSVAVRVNNTPGAEFRYSGGGMVVAQQLVKDVTEQPLPKFMEAVVLGPLAMTHSTFEQPLPTSLQSSAASAHDIDGHPLKGKWHTYPEQVAAGLWSTPSDLARYAIELQRSYVGTSNKVLSREMTRRMLTNSKNSPFGLGIVVSRPGKTLSFNHSGANSGYRALLFAYTESGRGAVIMTNADSGGEIIDELMRSLSKEYRWDDYKVVEKKIVSVDVNILRGYVGKYLIGKEEVLIRFDGDQLIFSAPKFGYENIEIFSEGDSKFFMLKSSTQLNFEKDDKGYITVEIIMQGKKIRATRVP